MTSTSTLKELDIHGDDDFDLENKRGWGEERVGGVIFNVVLKRVRKAPSTSNNAIDGLQWETQKVKSLKAATFQHLVSLLCKSFMEDCAEKNFLTVFFATYRSFAKPKDVLENIRLEFQSINEDHLDTFRGQLIVSIQKVLRTWLERYFEEDFYKPPDFPLLSLLVDFAKTIHHDSEDKYSKDENFVDYVQTKLEFAEAKNLQETSIEKLKIPKNFSDIHMETENITVDCQSSINHDAAKTLLNVFTTSHVAEQITIKDANLFLRVVPHHCLNAVRSIKYKPACVKATIDQFNKVVYCVLATCLCTSLKTSQRSKIFCKWIEIAQQCRELKNFSSLHAIVSTLQTHAIHRLKRTWQQVSTSHMSLLHEISQINIKDMIRKVGTAKVNTETSSISKVQKDATFRRQRDIHSGIMHGTVPYLGSFLTDLTYLHSARPDFIDENLINFDKCRKEFELLAQLQLWQASCKGYLHFETDDKFNEWINTMIFPSDDEANSLSEQIEPNIPVSPNPPQTPSSKRTLTEMFSSASLNDSTQQSLFAPSTEMVQSENSLPSIVTSVSAPKSNETEKGNEEERVVKVVIIKRNVSKEQTTIPEWKEIKVSSNCRTSTVKKMTFVVEGDDESESDFTLVQLLPDNKKLRIPESSNVFYAMNSSLKDLYFVLLHNDADIPVEIWSETFKQPPPDSLQIKKKRHRKTKSTSSVNLMPNSTSPIRSIYRHLALGSFSLMNSGSYSPAKESEKSALETYKKRDALETSPFLERRDALTTVDDVKLPENAIQMRHGYVNCEDSWQQKVWRKINRGHQGNSADQDIVFDLSGNREIKYESKSNAEVQLRQIILPVKNQHVKMARSESASSFPGTSVDTSSFLSSTENDVDSHLTITSLDNDVSPFTRRRVIRKHPNQTRLPKNEIKLYEEKRTASLNTQQGQNKRGLSSQSRIDSNFSSSDFQSRENNLANKASFNVYQRSGSDSSLLESGTTKEGISKSTMPIPRKSAEKRHSFL